MRERCVYQREKGEESEEEEEIERDEREGDRLQKKRGVDCE